jgi:hypothetical protein
MVGSSVKARSAANLAACAEHMKILLIVVVAAVIAGSIYADYRWRKWVDARRRERQDHSDS